MATVDVNEFSSLHGAIAQAECWSGFLAKTHDDDAANMSAEGVVGLGVYLGETLTFVWQVTFNDLFIHRRIQWTKTTEFDAMRQHVRRLFLTSREAMERCRSVAEAWQSRTGLRASEMDRLHHEIAAAQHLEETVFRDWPAFTDQLENAGESLPVDEALAQTLGVSIEEARRKMGARRCELHAKKE